MECIHSIKDLRVTMDSKLNFHRNILEICKDAKKCRGFIIRISSQFKKTQVIINEYNAYVRNKLSKFFNYYAS